MNQSGFVVVVNSSMATAVRAEPPTMTGFLPIESLSQPSGDEKNRVPT